jgi:hypothetical protein
LRTAVGVVGRDPSPMMLQLVLVLLLLRPKDYCGEENRF